jgi:hypothetical protein
LKRVTAVTGDRVAMASTLSDAVESLLTAQKPMPIFDSAQGQ